MTGKKVGTGKMGKMGGWGSPSDFFWKDRIQIDLKEYRSSSVSAKSGQAVLKTYPGTPDFPPSFKFSFFRLAVGIAKTVLTRDPEDDDLIKQVRSSLYQLDSTIASDTSDLRLVSRFRKKYRDFSKDSRMGELAQAVSFIFAQEVLGHPIVMDFHGFLDCQGIAEMSARDAAPDFALLLKDGVRIPWLLESKGSSPNSKSFAVKSKLKEALDQCDSGDNHLFANTQPVPYCSARSFGTKLMASEETDAWPSFLAFCDPENGGEQGMPSAIRAANRYYAAWFVVAGHRGLASRVNRGRLTLLEFMNHHEEMIVGDTVYLAYRSSSKGFDLFTPLRANKKGVLPRRTPRLWLIRKDIVLALIEQDEDKLVALFEEMASQPNQALDQGFMHFRDGTLCEISDAHDEARG
ncbi:hypothetical protein [Pandoraea captiosa]|nr:hypothetical protein [Pandoraea captiosa]